MERKFGRGQHGKCTWQSVRSWHWEWISPWPDTSIKEGYVMPETSATGCIQHGTTNIRKDVEVEKDYRITDFD